MIRILARLSLTFLLMASLALTAMTLVRIARNPLLTPLVDRSTAEIIATTDRMMAREATPERIAARLEARLAEPKRNWIAIDALQDAARELGISLPPDLTTRLQQSRDDDFSLWATATACAACAYDPAACTLSATLICQAPMVLTPLGDLAGLTLEATRYATGAEVDRINLTLSALGLAGAGLILASGGTSASIKIGASTAKLARKMGLISPRLTTLTLDAARTGIDWAALPAARSLPDLRATLRPAILAPVAAILTDTGRLATRLPPTQALHLLSTIDSAADARRLANLAEALGPKTVSRLEILGKARFLRAANKLSQPLIHLATGLAGLALALANVAGHWATGALIRLLRRLA